jgi:hypothetical protein
MSRQTLDAQLEEATRDFVGKILGILRNASLGDVASVQTGAGSQNRPTLTGSEGRSPRTEPTRRRGPKPRVSSTELEGRILEILGARREPVPARALADELGVPLDALGKPLKQLRDTSRIVKRGEKRASKYLLA